MTSWEKFDQKGYPVPLLEKMTTNVARTKIYKVKNVGDSVNGVKHNFVIANHFTLGDHNHVGYHTASASSSVFPYFVDPISDRNGTPITQNPDDLLHAGNPYYYFDCLDEAFETNLRIRMVVQEWDTVDALDTYISTGVSAIGPDVNGTAPANCSGQTGETCNQAADSDDFVLRNRNIPTQTYSTAVPARRKYYFPRSPY